jgi:hypothetical protein
MFGVPYKQIEVASLFMSGSLKITLGVMSLNFKKYFNKCSSSFTPKMIIELDSFFHFLNVSECS